MRIHQWGALGSFLVAVCMIVAPLIYLTGNLEDNLGVLGYRLADFLYGPLFSAGLITFVYVLRELIGGRAQRRMDLALMAALLAAVGMAAVAFIRASNRQYHLLHPELGLQSAGTVLVIWSTLVTGMSSLGFHFLGWAYVLMGSAGWSSRFFPRVLSGLYFLAGIAALFVYLWAELEGLVLLLTAFLCAWQGVLLFRHEARQPTEANG